MTAQESTYHQQVAHIPHHGIAGYFGPDSMTWRLYREPIPGIGSVRALLLQIAHPAVAAGVAQHSNFQADALGRGMRTFMAMAAIYFGDDALARATALRLHRIHAHINGAYTHPTDSQQMVAYQANTPDLLSWVLATLTETTIVAFETLPVKGLPDDWAVQFYEESKITAQLLGIPATYYPADLPAFRQYFSTVLHSDLLGSHPICREMAQAIVQHKLTPTRLAKIMAAGWLPAPLCERLGVTAGPHPEQRLQRVIGVIRFIFRLIPRPLRYAPSYYQALRRIARANSKRAPILGNWYHWLAKYTRIPLGLPVAN